MLQALPWMENVHVDICTVVVVVGHFGGGYGQAALGNHTFEVEAHAGMEANDFL